MDLRDENKGSEGFMFLGGGGGVRVLLLNSISGLDSCRGVFNGAAMLMVRVKGVEIGDWGCGAWIEVICESGSEGSAGVDGALRLRLRVSCLMGLLPRSRGLRCQT